MRRGARRGRHAGTDGPADARADYRALRHPFQPMDAFLDDQKEAMHEAAMDVPQSQAVPVPLAEARALLRGAGARVDDRSEMLFTRRQIAQPALATAPLSIPVAGGARGRDIILKPGYPVSQPVAGTPHAADPVRGKRSRSRRGCGHLCGRLAGGWSAGVV
ncbi:MAG: trimethylamine methyltransferase family protein [Alphaproteobacteria bacterium]|nr:trimethylamine methyltransferase family protein [Alphaproteobacteria bacterium]NNF24073.1 hypothetical protein [Paracoccaceae bacterium]